MKRFIGSREFYAMVLALIIPIIIQQGITNFVNLLDNVMVGRLGTESMSGVAIVNQLMFVFNISVFGIVSGASIFGAQYFGNNDHVGVRYAFRYKVISVAVLCTIAIIVFLNFGDSLIQLYLSNEDNSDIKNLEFTFSEAQDYLKIMLLSMPPFALAQCYNMTLRENSETKVQMFASSFAIAINLSLNAILIFGLLGFPALGVRGAAIATVIARYTETAYMICMTHKAKDRFKFAEGAYKSLKLPWPVAKKIIIMGSPLFINEITWAIGMAAITQNYSERGLSVMAALNISTTISNLFMIVMYGMGGAISIIVGQALGSGDIEKAKDLDRKLIFFNVALYVAIGLILASLSPFVPLIYNTEDTVRHLATGLLLVYACFMPLQAFNYSAYFTMRSGGKTFITFLFDSVFLWVIPLPLSTILVSRTSLYIVAVYALVIGADFIKATVALILLKKGIWARNIIL